MTAARRAPRRSGATSRFRACGAIARAVRGRGRHTDLEPIGVDLAAVEVDLLRLVGHLGGTEAALVSHEDYERVGGAVAVAAGEAEQPLYLGMSVRCWRSRNSRFGGRRGACVSMTVP